MNRPHARALLTVVLLAGASLDAPHSVPVHFDQSREVTFAAALTEVAWRNPHARFPGKP